MKLRLVASYFGPFEPGVLEPSLEALRERGYDAVEFPLFLVPDVAAASVAAKQAGLEIVPLVLTGGYTGAGDLAVHVNDLEAALRQVQALNPPYVVCHGGRDDFGAADRSRFFEAALELVSTTGIKLAHETHRGRILFTPWRADEALTQFPSLNICCDLSHWTCVCEDLLDDHKAAIAKVAAATLQVDARVGFEQGPQVSDPTLPIWSHYLDWYLARWQEIWSARESRSAEQLYFHPEFLTYYAPKNLDGELLCDVEVVNDRVADILRKRFSD